MKKYIIVFIIIICFSVFLIIRKKDKSYSIQYMVDSYSVKEEYIDGVGFYIDVLMNNNWYPFFEEDIYKGSNLIYDIKELGTSDAKCLTVYMVTGSEASICYDNGFLSAYMAGLISEKDDFLANYNRLQIYDKFDNNRSLVIWNYKGIDIISDEYSSVNYLEYDQYDNTHAIMIDKYYITPDYNEKYRFKTWVIIDVTNGKLDKFIVDNYISYDSYILGVVDKKIYLFDHNSLLEYEIDILNREINIIGNKANGGKYYRNGVWEDINIYDFHRETLLFKYLYDYETDSCYYQYNDNTLFRIYKNDLNKKIRLFEMKGISNIKVKDDNIYFLKDDTIYMYDDDLGLKKIVSNNEFKYNNRNIFEIGNNNSG